MVHQEDEEATRDREEFDQQQADFFHSLLSEGALGGQLLTSSTSNDLHPADLDLENGAEEDTENNGRASSLLSPHGGTRSSTAQHRTSSQERPPQERPSQQLAWVRQYVTAEVVANRCSVRFPYIKDGKILSALLKKIGLFADGLNALELVDGDGNCVIGNGDRFQTPVSDAGFRPVPSTVSAQSISTSQCV